MKYYIIRKVDESFIDYHNNVKDNTDILQVKQTTHIIIPVT